MLILIGNKQGFWYHLVSKSSMIYTILQIQAAASHIANLRFTCHPKIYMSAIVIRFFLSWPYKLYIQHTVFMMIYSYTFSYCTSEHFITITISVVTKKKRTTAKTQKKSTKDFAHQAPGSLIIDVETEPSVSVDDPLNYIMSPTDLSDLHRLYG